MDSDDVKRAEVIVVGAGITGTTAAKALNDEGIDVITLEASNRVGGRVYTKKTSLSTYADLGGQYIGPFDHDLMNLCQELSVEIYNPPPPTGSLAFYTRGRTGRYRTSLPIWNPVICMDLNNFFRTLKTESSKVPLNAPWKAKNARELDQMTAKQWIEDVCFTETVKKIATALVSVTFCVEPGEVSLLFLLWFRGKAGCLFYDFLFSVPPSFEVDGPRFVGGGQQLCEKMTESFADKVLLNNQVQDISQDGDRVAVKTRNGNIYEADYVICTVPVPMVQGITFSPPLPGLQSQAYNRICMGSCIKTVTYYRKPFWIEKGFNGNCVILDDDEPVNFIVDDTNSDGSYPALLSYITARRATILMSYTTEERKQRLCELYAKVFQTEEAKQPVDYIECDWSSEQYIGGGHASFYPPGVLTNYARSMEPSFGRILFSTADNIQLPASFGMNAAIGAGSSAAKQVLYRKGRISKEDVDQDNQGTDVFSKPGLSWRERLIPSVPHFVQAVNLLLILSVFGSVLLKSRK